MSEIPNINSNVINSNIINSNVINNANVNTNIPNNANEVPNVGILGGPRIISTIDPPVVQSAQQSLIRSLEKPIIRGADTSIKYPTLDVPTQEAFNAAVNAERKKQEKEKEEEEEKVMKGMGKAMMGTGEAEGDKREINLTFGFLSRKEEIGRLPL